MGLIKWRARKEHDLLRFLEADGPKITRNRRPRLDKLRRNDTVWRFRAAEVASPASAMARRAELDVATRLEGSDARHQSWQVEASSIGPIVVASRAIVRAGRRPVVWFMRKAPIPAALRRGGSGSQSRRPALSRHERAVEKKLPPLVLGGQRGMGRARGGSKDHVFSATQTQQRPNSSAHLFQRAILPKIFRLPQRNACGDGHDGISP